MRTLSFWCGIAAALLCGLAEPVWGYAAVGVLSLVQLALLGAPGASVFLLVHYSAVLTYFSLAPALQIAADQSFWDLGVVGPAAHTQALLLLLLYLAGVEAARLGTPDAAPAPAGGAQPLPGVAHPLWVLGLLGLAFAALWVRPELNFVARGVVDDTQSAAFELIFGSTLPKALVLMGFVALAMHALRRRTAGALCLAGVALALAAVAANPVNTARQILLIGVLPLLIHGLGRSRRWTLALLILGAIAGLGPVLNLISRGSMWGESLSAFPYSPDFDTMYVLAGILERAPAPEPGLGRYLLSALSFVLPRELKLFPDFDPLGWPAILGHFSQRNLSLAHFATAYFDFGWAGPLLLGAAISAGFKRADLAVTPRGAISTRTLAALVLLAAYVPLMRGPILGWGPFAASGLIAALAVGPLCSGLARARRSALRVPFAPA